VPAWLGWSAVVIAVLFITPLEFAGFVLLLLWVVAVSILTTRRGNASA
jgi:hypothetical protein